MANSKPVFPTNFLLLIFISIFFSNSWTSLHAQEIPTPEGRRIREIVSENYFPGNLLMGCTTGSWAFGTKTGKIMDREFNYVTPENDFKHAVVRRDSEKWQWSRADAWIDHIHENNQILRIHGPIGPQCSDWAKADKRTGRELKDELKRFMTALCKRYNDVEGIEYIDVVNETVLSDGKWHHPKPGTEEWENPWLKIGRDDDPNQTPLYIKQAFEISNKHATDLKQLFNNHCAPGTKGMEMVKKTIMYLRKHGFRVDALGWQAHIKTGWDTPENLKALDGLITWCHQYNLEFHITEFSAWIDDPEKQTFRDQAETYREILEVLIEHRNDGVVGWNTWHITDANGWQNERLPSLFDDRYNPKPAYYAIQRLLMEKAE